MGLNIKDLRIESPAFGNDEPMADRYSKYHDNVVPPLRWSGLPEGTRQLALVCHDPDAPLVHGWTHWVVYGIAPDVTEVAEDGAAPGAEGVNDFGETGWGGPMPPAGHGTHHYYFWLYALDTEIDAEPGLNRVQLLERIDGHVLEQARLVGVYEK